MKEKAAAKEAKKARKHEGKLARTLARPKADAIPSDRGSLLVLHRELRHKRDSLPLLSEERAETVIELARVEVEIARIERAMNPPLL
jgi:hypothetical protein